MQLVRPMEPAKADVPFDDADFQFQLKWDGIRLLALHTGAGQTRLFTRRHVERTAQYPDVVTAVNAACGDRPALLDGEAVVLRQGRPWFPDVLRRDRQRTTPSASTLQQLPVYYAVFDLLYWQGRETMHWPLEERTHELSRLAGTSPGLVVVTSLPTAGRKLFELAVETHWEGIVAKRSRSPYVPGRKLPYWLKVKRKQRHLFAVIGCTVQAGQAAALLLGGYRDGVLHYCGRAGTGLSQADWQSVYRFVTSSPRLQAPGVWPPRLDGVEAVWTEPQLTVWIEFLEWTEGLRVRHPVIVGFSRERPEAAWV